MNGNDEKQAALEDLHAELENTECTSKEQQAQLDAVKEHVSAALEDPTAESYHGLIGRLQASVAHFEQDHPGLTVSLDRAITTLSVGGV